jgi:hypothetical protein
MSGAPAVAGERMCVPVPAFVEVVTRAGRRCECTGRGCHGSGERCQRSQPGQRLIVAPRDVTVPARLAWRVPLPELAAWCVRCHDLAVADRRRRGRESAAASVPTLPLSWPQDLEMA